MEAKHVREDPRRLSLRRDGCKHRDRRCRDEGPRVSATGGRPRQVGHGAVRRRERSAIQRLPVLAGTPLLGHLRAERDPRAPRACRERQLRHAIDLPCRSIHRLDGPIRRERRGRPSVGRASSHLGRGGTSVPPWQAAAALLEDEFLERWGLREPRVVYRDADADFDVLDEW